jgi:hypothetical protein
VLKYFQDTAENPSFQHAMKVLDCSCGQFERIGILCAPALKVLDLMNIKLLSSHYI